MSPPAVLSRPTSSAVYCHPISLSIRTILSLYRVVPLQERGEIQGRDEIEIRTLFFQKKGLSCLQATQNEEGARKKAK